MALYKVVYAHVLNPLSDKKCNLLKDHALIAKKYTHGYKIIEICSRKKAEKFLINKRSYEVHDHSGKIIMPGFYDMHFHWVQDEVRQMPKENLLKWLEKYTWPYESNFKNKSFAKKKAKSFAKEILSLGTIGGACYGSIHEHSVDQAHENFIGDYIIGNVLMTMNSPDYLTQTSKQAKKTVETLAAKHKHKYAMTPRFAITTDPETMTYGAKVAKKNRSFIQTHLSETLNEIDFVLSIYKDIPEMADVKTYTEIYDRCNLLGPKTIMGHGIYLSAKELKRLAQTKTAIAHCPTSNAPHKELGLGSGLFDFKTANRHKVRWALATDIGGGPFLSMLDVMNSFVNQNKRDGHKDASYSQALYRSTMSGAEILQLDKESGNFKKDKWLSYVVLDAPKMSSSDDSESLMKKLIYRKNKDREQFKDLIEGTCYRGQYYGN